MIRVSKNQVRFLNFADLIRHLHSLNNDIDLSKSGPDNSVFSKTKGIIAGANFYHLVKLLNDEFDFKFQASGCIQSWEGYLMAWDGEFPEAKKEEKDLSGMTKVELLEIAKQKSIEIKLPMKNEDIISAIKSV